MGWWPEITDCIALATLLSARAGVLEHGLFIDVAGGLIVTGASGVRNFPRAPGVG
jgi:ribose 5-phosphate isomerase